MLLENHFGHDFVQRQTVSQGTGTYIGDTDHLQNARYVSVTGLTLYSVRHVEHQTRTFSLQNPRHKFLKTVDEVLIALEGLSTMFVGPESVRDSLDGLLADAFAVGDSKKIDDVFRISIVNNSYLHNITLKSRLVYRPGLDSNFNYILEV